MAYGKLLLSPLSVVAVYFACTVIVVLLLIVAHVLQWLGNKLTRGKARVVQQAQSAVDSFVEKYAAVAMAVVAVPIHGWYASSPLVMVREIGEGGGPSAAAHAAALFALVLAAALVYGVLWLADEEHRRRLAASGVVGVATLGAYVWLLTAPDTAIRLARAWKTVAWAGLEMMLGD